MNRHIYWIWLRMALQGNVKMMYALYTAIGSAEDIFRGNRDQYYEWGISDNYIPALVDKDLTAAYNILGQCERFGIGILSIEDDEYPQSLREIALPPCILFYQGDLISCLNTPMITVIGTRHTTASGEAIATVFGRELSISGFTLVCGVAEGIEEVLYKSVIQEDGRCILFLPCGILSVNNRVRYMIKNVAVRGAAVSEWLPHERSSPDAYHVRNRLLCALTPGTLVLQSPKRSGTQITVNYALSQGKDVFTIPGGLMDPSFAGNNQMLRDGAIPVLEAKDIADYYKSRYEDALFDIVVEDDEFEQFVRSVSQRAEFESEEQQIIYGAVAPEGSTIDELVLKTELETHVVLSQITLMEMNGWVKAIPGGKYKIIS